MPITATSVTVNLLHADKLSELCISDSTSQPLGYLRWNIYLFAILSGNIEEFVIVHRFVNDVALLIICRPYESINHLFSHILIEL